MSDNFVSVVPRALNPSGLVSGRSFLPKRQRIGIIQTILHPRILSFNNTIGEPLILRDLESLRKAGYADSEALRL